jgi:hypothetical protein
MMKKVKSVGVLTKKLERVFNAYIRERDKELGCISCGSFNEIQAGHFYSAGHFSWLRFNEDNVHSQCKRCNYFLRGNLLPYRERLIKKIGTVSFQKLEIKSQIRKVNKYSRFELEALIIYYRDKIKTLKKAA